MNWGNICRVCSSPADYDIFAKIPTYLHASTNEILNWQKPINLLIEETTGLKYSVDDGLPRYICAPCISYLKHAATFREQCIKNTLSLKLAELYAQKSEKIEDSDNIDKESALFTAEDLQYVDRRTINNLLLNNCAKLDSSDKVHKQLLTNKGENCEHRVRYLNVLFDKQRNASRRSNKTNVTDIELPTTSGGSGNGTGEDDDYPTASSSDENEEKSSLARQDKNCYNYSETNFEEDDPMEHSDLHNRAIKVNIPQLMWKERKCPACFKRFMFEETHKTHVDNCVEHQFATFIAEVNKLLDIRRQKMVSPHEFIRRTIFALHKTCTWLQEHSVDNLPAEKLKQIKLSFNGAAEPVAALAEAIVQLSPNQDIDRPSDRTAQFEDADLQPFNFADTSNKSFSDTVTLNKRLSGNVTPITMANNVLYAIERSESRNSQKTPVVKKPIPIRGGPLLRQSPCSQPAADDEAERASFLEKLQRATGTPIAEQSHNMLNTPTSTGNLNFSARCSECNLMFDSVSELEDHNVTHHNASSLLAKEEKPLSVDETQRRRIIALFEDDI